MEGKFEVLEQGMISLGTSIQGSLGHNACSVLHRLWESDLLKF